MKRFTELEKLAATFSGMGRLISKAPSATQPLRSFAKTTSPQLASQQSKILGMLKSKSGGNISSEFAKLREMSAGGYY